MQDDHHGVFTGARMRRLHASHSFGLVLALVLTSIVLTASAPDADWALSLLVLLQAATLALALWTAGRPREAARGGIVLAVGAAALATTQLLFDGHMPGLIGITSALLLLATFGVVGLGVWDQREVNTQSVLGVITNYLLIGLLFTFAYSAAAALGDGPLFAQGTDGTATIRLYFSFVTLATLGYGDYTPAGEIGQMLAISEALVGQLYLVTVVAVVVGRLRPRAAA